MLWYSLLFILKVGFHPGSVGKNVIVHPNVLEEASLMLHNVVVLFNPFWWWRNWFQ